MFEFNRKDSKTPAHFKKAIDIDHIALKDPIRRNFAEKYLFKGKYSKNDYSSCSEESSEEDEMLSAQDQSESDYSDEGSQQSEESGSPLPVDCPEDSAPMTPLLKQSPAQGMRKSFSLGCNAGMKRTRSSTVRYSRNTDMIFCCYDRYAAVDEERQQ